MSELRTGLFACFCLMMVLGCDPTPSTPSGPTCEFVTTAASAVQCEKEPEFVPGEIIVKYRAGAEAPQTSLETLGTMSVAQQVSGGATLMRIATPAGTEASADVTMAAVELLRQDPNVEYADPNWIFHAHRVPDDTCYPDQWHYRNFGTGADESEGGIDLPRVWDTNTGSASVVVAVIDTGIVASHPDIGPANQVPGYDMISNAFSAADGDGRDNDPTDPGDLQNSFHGTHVAGTVGVVGTNNAGGVAGVNWTVKIQTVRVLGRTGGSFADINDGIRWAAGLPVPGVPDNATPARVINMSLGGAVSCPAAQQAAIDDATAAGALVVVSAGNSAADASGFAPAGCDNVFSIAASGPRGRLAPYSNHTKVDILAPGGDTSGGAADGVLSTVSGGYAFYQGTSMAAPHVSGVAALVLADDPTLTPAALKAKMVANVRPRNATHCPQPCGAGLMNAFFP